ncbi:MAG TPA: hypothetical protein VJ718_05405, partial [Candidatus Binataceae bacterium]|nr:hypothetical protein [Candidatus Binataceae bacterium]
MSLKTLHPGQSRRLRRKPRERSGGRADYTGSLKEIVSPQGRGEARRAAGWQDVIGTGEIIAQR